MRLTTADNRQNTYTFKRPVTKDGTLTGYAKIILFMDTQDNSWNRLDLIKEVLNRDFTYNRNSNRGSMINIFATLNVNEILSYSSSDRRWKKGRNFEEYISTYLSEYRA